MENYVRVYEGCVRCVHESTYVREDVVGAEAVLEQGGLRTTLINAVEAATMRSRELGRGGGGGGGDRGSS